MYCVLYHLVVRAASVDGCLCLSGSLPLIFFLYACAYFEANKYDDDDVIITKYAAMRLYFPIAVASGFIAGTASVVLKSIFVSLGNIFFTVFCGCPLVMKAPGNCPVCPP